MKCAIAQSANVLMGNYITYSNGTECVNITEILHTRNFLSEIQKIFHRFKARHVV